MASFAAKFGREQVLRGIIGCDYFSAYRKFMKDFRGCAILRNRSRITVQ